MQALIASARRSVGLTDGLEERRSELQFLFARWRLLREQMREIEPQIVALVEFCPEAFVLTMVPEVSTICAATVVAELGRPETYEHPAQII